MSKVKVDELTIDGTVYVPKDSVLQKAKDKDGMPMVMVRTYSAGVHFGYLKSRESTLAGIEVELVDARRVYYWDGAATLSQLAVDGTTTPGKCKFPCEVPSIQLVAIEITEMTQKAIDSLKSVKVWKR